MKHFFDYNWQVRDEWFEILKSVSLEELHKKKVGGVGSIADTMHHIVMVEASWILFDLQRKAEPDFEFSVTTTIEDLKDFSLECRMLIKPFIENWNNDMDAIRIDTEDSPHENFAFGEIIRHVIAHEIHHIGQLSIWAREAGLKPASANLIRRNLF